MEGAVSERHLGNAYTQTFHCMLPREILVTVQRNRLHGNAQLTQQLEGKAALRLYENGPGVVWVGEHVYSHMHALM